MLRVQGRRRG